MGSDRQKRQTAVALFQNDLEAEFLRRPNRFLIIAKKGNQELACHCPNPGRMWEMFFPGARLILEKRPGAALGASQAKTGYTAAGIYYRDGVAPLFSARANRAAEALILKKIIPGLAEIHREFTLGNSRFDFLCVDRQGGRHLVEVKACSLVEHGAAMFPDAPSVRALKHLEELAALGEQGYHGHVLFVIVHGNAAVFIPNLHTDPELAAALSRYGQSGGPVRLHAALIRCNREGQAALINAAVPVDLSHGELAAHNSGAYLVILELAGAASIAVGSLGTRTFAGGWYVYAGSALKNLSRRLSRHLRKTRKQKHWHLDYLTPHAKTIAGLPVRSYRSLECDLAAALKNIGGTAIPGFGSSDCRKKCESHLFYFSADPMENRAFVELLFRFRHVESLRKPPLSRACGNYDSN
jgi:sugar fermentation stimulation protein A